MRFFCLKIWLLRLKIRLILLEFWLFLQEFWLCFLKLCVTLQKFSCFCLKIDCFSLKFDRFILKFDCFDLSFSVFTWKSTFSPTIFGLMFGYFGLQMRLKTWSPWCALWPWPSRPHEAVFLSVLQVVTVGFSIFILSNYELTLHLFTFWVPIWPVRPWRHCFDIFSHCACDANARRQQ